MPLSKGLFYEQMNEVATTGVRFVTRTTNAYVKQRQIGLT